MSLTLGAAAAGAATYIVTKATDRTPAPPARYAHGCEPAGKSPRFVAVLLEGINSSITSSSTFDPTSVSYCAWPDGSTSGPPNNPSPALRSMADGWLNFSYDTNSRTYDKTDQATAVAQRNLIDRLAAAGGYVLPFSYVEHPSKTGAVMSGTSAAPLFTAPAYSPTAVAIDDPRYDEPPALQSEISSIHRIYPDTPIIVIGHSNGGLIAEQWWLRYRDAAANGVRHVFSLDSPVNGVADAGAVNLNPVHCVSECVVGGVGKTTGNAYSDMWNNKIFDPTEGDVAVIAADSRQRLFTAVGSYGDPLYDAGDWSPAQLVAPGFRIGYASQMVLDPACFGTGAFQANYDHTNSACAPLAGVDFVDPCALAANPEDGAYHAPAYGIVLHGSLWMHSIVKNCAGVISYILSTLTKPSGSTPGGVKPVNTSPGADDNLADSIMLRRSDLPPGWRYASALPGDDLPFSQKEQACVGHGDPNVHMTGTSRGSVFFMGQTPGVGQDSATVITSEVQLAATPAQAQGDLALVETNLYSQCAQQIGEAYDSAVLANNGGTAQEDPIQPANPAHYGLPPSTSTVLTQHSLLTIGTATTTVDSVQAFVLVGRIELSASVLSFGLGPPSPDLLRTAITAMIQRADAASH